MSNWTRISRQALQDRCTRVWIWMQSASCPSTLFLQLLVSPRLCEEIRSCISTSGLVSLFVPINLWSNYLLTDVSGIVFIILVRAGLNSVAFNLSKHMINSMGTAFMRSHPRTIPSITPGGIDSTFHHQGVLFSPHLLCCHPRCSHHPWDTSSILQVR